MSTTIGHFEIISELAKSATGTVYKANDLESGQTIALKAIQLSAFGDSAKALEQALLAEAEETKALSSPNITTVYGAGEIEGQFCAAMEYVQGNSIATMLARKEGFSIWDLLDIGRQLCGGLDHASSKNLVHYSLEPAKIMCGWDGTVKILSFGISRVGSFAHLVSEGLPMTLHYMSPEQVQGQPMDGRSNIFSLGAMLYEMVTERKAFDRDDIESLRQSIAENTPVPPIHVSPKVHPLLSDLIMKALAKDPAERYQNGRALLDDLEKCKESKSAAKKPEAKGTMAPQAAKSAAQSKFVGAKTPTASAPERTAPKPAAPAPSGLARSSTLATPSPRAAEPKPGLAKPAVAKSGLAVPKAAAAAAGAGSISDSSSLPAHEPVQEIDLSDHVINSPANPERHSPSSYMSAAASAVEPEVETFEPAATSPKIAVDPMMAGGGSGAGAGTSFSEISELPPLKEEYVPPPPPPTTPAATHAEVKEPPKATMFDGTLPKKADEKPKVQPREVAEKAIKEIKSVPARLMLYALGAAGIIILVIAIGVTIYIHNLGSDDDGGGRRSVPAAENTPTPQETTRSAPAPVAEAPKPVEREPSVAQPAVASRVKNNRKKATPEPVAVIPGQLSIDSTPQGAQVQIDGRGDPSWITPSNLTNLQPGQHTLTISKAGYATDTRTVAVTSGYRSTTVVHLNQLMATLIVKSDPAGANIYVDGRDVGAKTPAQVSVDKGQHVVLVRMMGYIDETMNAQFVLGQTFNFAPSLRPLGNADNIRTVGKMSKLFGGKGVQPGQATLSIRTQPKGAQVAVNQHLVEKMSPVDVALDPGNYVIDITMTGFAPVHKVITADKGGKVVVDEVLQKQ